MSLKLTEALKLKAGSTVRANITINGSRITRGRDYTLIIGAMPYKLEGKGAPPVNCFFRIKGDDRREAEVWYGDFDRAG